MKNRLIVAIVYFIYLLSVKAQDITIPFDFYDNKFILLKLKSENNQNLTFVFSTGTDITIIDKDKISNKRIFLDKDVEIENIRIVYDDISKNRELIGIPIDGFIGYDILKNYVTKIDFQNKKLELYKNTSPNKAGYTGLSFEFYDDTHIPKFPITIMLENGLRYTGDVILDSGLDNTLILNSPFVESNTLTTKLRKSFISHRKEEFGNEYYRVTTTNIRNLRLGTFSFDKLPIDLSSDQIGISSKKEFMGILGSNVFNKFDAIFDYKNFVIYMKSNYLHPAKFTIPVSPIKLKKTINGIIISEVVSDSDAWHKGLRVGQRIISINGKTSDNLSVYNEILNKKNRNITIKYLDNNIEKVVKFKLKELL